MDGAPCIPSNRSDEKLSRLARMKNILEAGKMNVDNFIDNSILLKLEKEGFITEVYADKSK